MMAVNLLAAVVIVLRGLYAINQMGRATRAPIRATWLLLTGAAAAMLLASAAPTWPEVVLHIGIAALVLVDRRNPLLHEDPK